jgi:hypothetical protein
LKRQEKGGLTVDNEKLAEDVSIFLHIGISRLGACSMRLWVRQVSISRRSEIPSNPHDSDRDLARPIPSKVQDVRACLDSRYLCENRLVGCHPPGEWVREYFRQNIFSQKSGSFGFAVFSIVWPRKIRVTPQIVISFQNIFWRKYYFRINTANPNRPLICELLVGNFWRKQTVKCMVGGSPKTVLPDTGTGIALGTGTYCGAIASLECPKGSWYSSLRSKTRKPFAHCRMRLREMNFNV